MGLGSENGPDEMRARRERDVAALLNQISYLEEEIGLLRRKVERQRWTVAVSGGSDDPRRREVEPFRFLQHDVHQLRLVG